MSTLSGAVRYAFQLHYGMEHPLLNPVRLRDLKTGHVEEFTSWYTLAEKCEVEFPEVGSWRPEEVLESAWFFS